MKYSTIDGKSFADDGDGPVMLANFTATITHEVRYVDGIKTDTVFTLEGEMMTTGKDGKPKPKKLPAVEIPAEQFGNMNWIAGKWGAACVIMPGSSNKDWLRTMIQLQSKPEEKTVYRATGWEEIEGKRTYLHVGGGITAKGNDASITVQLPNDLARYDLRCDQDPKACVAAALSLLNLTSDTSVTWPLLAATLAPLYGPVDFGFSLTGTTGSFKSETASLFQSFYGSGMDARHLPAQWSGTDNALELLAFMARNAVIVIDDFVPHGSKYDQGKYQGKAERLFRSQGNQQGRSRMTDVSSMQTTVYPRGLILSTGEDTPLGVSIRSRMMIREVSKGTVTKEALTECQGNRAMYPGVTAWLCQSLAANWPNLTDRMNAIRAEFSDASHTRSASTVAALLAVMEDILGRWREAKFINASTASRLLKECRDAIACAGADQARFLEEVNPVKIFATGIQQVLRMGAGHLRTLKGGPPRMATAMGWTPDQEAGGMITYKPHGPCIGWVNMTANEIYLDDTIGFNAVSKVCGSEIPLTKASMLKRLVEASMIGRKDSRGGRNTLRITAENVRRTVICMPLNLCLDLQETEDNGEE